MVGAQTFTHKHSNTRNEVADAQALLTQVGKRSKSQCVVTKHLLPVSFMTHNSR